jgi:hypothetical protein
MFTDQIYLVLQVFMGFSAGLDGVVFYFMVDNVFLAISIFFIAIAN